MRNSSDCPTCRLVRFYLFLSIPLIAVLGFSSVESERDGGVVLWFARLELIDFLAWGSLISCIVVLMYRVYVEFWLPRRRAEALDRLLESEADETGEI